MLLHYLIFKFLRVECHLIFILFIFILKSCLCVEQVLTVTVLPGREECFYQHVTKGQIIDIEFQVIDTGSGNFDIHFGLYTPQNKPVIVDLKKTEAAHRHEAKENGDYKVCFDNSFSRMSNKIVYFELIVDSGEEDDDEEEEDEEDSKSGAKFGVIPEEVYELTVEDIEEKIDVVRANLQKVRHMQEQIRAFEARDRNTQERNFSMVNRWSTVQLTVMILVGAVQLVMVRSLFDEKSRVHKLWQLNFLNKLS